jgi:small subunit ribosomal protein S6
MLHLQVGAATAAPTCHIHIRLSASPQRWDRATPPSTSAANPEGRSHALREHANIPRDYEMMLVVAPTVAEEGLQAVIDRVSGYVTTQGGTVDSTSTENPWGRRRLAYPINDHRDAFYVVYRFTAEAASILEIEREIKLDEQVIRHLVVRYDEMTEHEERPPRGDARRGAPAGAAPGTPAEAGAPPASTARVVQPVEPDAAAVAATRRGDTDASVVPADPGDTTETDDAETDEA